MKVPTFGEAAINAAAGKLSPLDHFVLNNEPAGNAEERAFREGLQSLLDYVETECDLPAENERLRARIVELEAWQPIETAPRDGSRIIAWCEEWTAPLTVQYYRGTEDGWRLHYDLGPFSYQPTHWKPLPLPPER